VSAADGKVQVWKDPKGRGPYGIATAPDGNVWYVSLAGSHLARIDSANGQISVIEPPTKDAGLRRVWADSRGDLWITGWNSGELYRYRPSNKSWKTWKLPGTAPKAYAVYVDERDMVWVSDFGDNSTRVFNPKTEKFVQRYPGSGEGANVRQILGRKGEVFLPESGTERLMVIRTDQ
jgi:virginiamycin B lyase